MNKDLILREFLAIERTKMANQTTFLAYIRTGLYFLVAGTTLGQLVETLFWKYMSIPIAAVGLAIIVTGWLSFRKNRKEIENGKRQIGEIRDDFLKKLGVDLKSSL
jgi:putative membrane protein